MSLTSYRAAPPRDKPLRASSGPEINRSQRRKASIGQVLRFLRTQPGATPLGCERYVSTPARFGKARIVSFRGFYPVERAISHEIRPRQAAPTLGGIVADPFDFIVVGGCSGG